MSTRSTEFVRLAGKGPRCGHGPMAHIGCESLQSVRLRLFRSLAALAVTLFVLALPAPAQTFFLSPGADPAGDGPWQAAVGSFTEFDFDSVTSGRVDTLMAGGLTVDVGLQGTTGVIESAVRTFVSSSNFTVPGAVYQIALVNAAPPNSIAFRSQMTFDFSQPVVGFGAWVYDDSEGVRESCRMIATDVHGNEYTSDALEAGNGFTHAIEGFIGVGVTDGHRSRCNREPL